MESRIERELRDRIIAWVLQRAEANGGFIERSELADFHLDGDRLPLIDRGRGIRNPTGFRSTLSVVQTVGGPYDDIESDDGLIHYRYRAGDIDKGDNAKLREAAVTGQPLILFRKEEKNIYTPVAPVFVIADDPASGYVTIALDESFRLLGSGNDLTEPQRQYARRLATQRLHQPAFRTRVMLAYETHCAICHLAHGSLLDAAHIVPDSAPGGAPTVSNGLALCKIHHASYDQDLLGITPDYEVRINADLLAERDGPMLTHGLQEMHGRKLTIPRRKADAPDRDRLAWRWTQFASTGH
ncbi:HNH endonuclease [Brooklawnia cerclae]|uniref:Restriction endonuclease n=1 Tax=Brooklawnia cerclae TaxID=349934 RepID=A0ABX0SG84_9ACTN|nr:HNH endonuclease [Brooklawnia cerclae]NIH55702.1 putative restriction endonuclease [Brooklawnia cerclae]